MCSAELHLCREAPLTMAAWTCSSIAFKAPTWALHLGDDVLQRRGGRQRSSQDGRCINQPRFELGLICSALRLHILPLEVVRGPFIGTAAVHLARAAAALHHCKRVLLGS